jgi:hypothetical protein
MPGVSYASPAVRQPGYLLFDRPLGFAPPPRGKFAFIAAPRRQHEASMHHTLVGGNVMCTSAVSASEHQGSAELLRAPSTRSSASLQPDGVAPFSHLSV